MASKKKPRFHYFDKFVDPRTNKKIEVRWKKKLWDYHNQKHQLISLKNASVLIKSTIDEPCLVMAGKAGPKGGKEKQLCYYRYEKGDGGFINYTKVVVGCSSYPFYVKSVWNKWALPEFVVKEYKYIEFKEKWRKDDCKL